MSVKSIVHIRKYEQNGEEKTAFDNVGILIQKPDGKISLKLNCIPVGGWDGWLIVTEKKQKDAPAPDMKDTVEPF